ncbi:uncharacterized protein LOC108914564 [Anoplophora glabripennis]|uniref:Clarin-3 n=1 Tax=Anoplophora glabripennis TaxID=217634 RepID=V5GT72_ANOGL|nr:uncharacterized protein LOC108914564 [Anoplophora glabripennis]
MATVKREFIFIVCILSAIGALLTLVSLVTEQWVVTDNALWLSQGLTKPNTIKYGLFQGFYTQEEPSPLTVQLTMTCLIGENVCALLCGKNDDERNELLRQLYNNDANAVQNNDNCPTIQRSLSPWASTGGVSRADTEESDDKKFINAGVWVSTIFFLSVSIAFGLASSALSIWNIVSNPVQVYFSIFGLYISNAIALTCTVIGMCLWGVMHIQITFHDVGIFYTLSGQMTSDKSAGLGYSYWILFVPIIFYCASIILLYVRHFLLSRDPGHKRVQREDVADPGIYLY